MSRRVPLMLPRLTPSPTAIADASAAHVAEDMRYRFGGPVHRASQVLDGNQLRKLSLTLGRRMLYPGLDVTKRAPPDGTPLPPGYHLVYFTPNGVESDLGRDGGDVTFNAPASFGRRVWAGGRVWYGDKEAALRVGDEVEEHTRFLDAVPKASSDGTEMVLTRVEKQFWGPRGLAVVDERNWIFRHETALDTPKRQVLVNKALSSSVVIDKPRNETYPDRYIRWSPTSLFRFSALTFNAHRIHYDQAWTATEEGHWNCVVHGPLTLINMLDYWRDHCGRNKHLKEITYRAVAPIYTGQQSKMSAKKVGFMGQNADINDKTPKSNWEIVVSTMVLDREKTCMTASIVAAGLNGVPAKR
ncbi:hypothetical protein F4802DRAFT_570639 [Xylaria palmicola]|nr:hypothetical protein F4802DRAFT_570639 [Xylaria palmicola]